MFLSDVVVHCSCVCEFWRRRSGTFGNGFPDANPFPQNERRTLGHASKPLSQVRQGCAPIGCMGFPCSAPFPSSKCNRVRIQPRTFSNCFISFSLPHVHANYMHFFHFFFSLHKIIINQIMIQKMWEFLHQVTFCVQFFFIIFS